MLDILIFVLNLKECPVMTFVAKIEESRKQYLRQSWTGRDPWCGGVRSERVCDATNGKSHGVRVLSIFGFKLS